MSDSSTGIYAPAPQPFNPVPVELQGVPLATLQTWLLAAQTALQNLMIGALPQTVSYAQGEGNRTVTYTRAQVPQLRAWIAQLQLAINPTNTALRRGPTLPYF
jgi:hypothetical protein